MQVNPLDLVIYKIRETVPDYAYDTSHFRLRQGEKGTIEIYNWSLDMPMPENFMSVDKKLIEKKCCCSHCLEKRVKALEYKLDKIIV